MRQTIWSCRALSIRTLRCRRRVIPAEGSVANKTFQQDPLGALPADFAPGRCPLAVLMDGLEQAQLPGSTRCSSQIGC
jgi:hypothetical protein